MGPSVAEEILDEFLLSFEALETQTEAIVQFLKDKGIATDEQLAPYLEKARNASTVRWRAARLRTNRLFATAFNAADKTQLKPPETFVDSDRETWVVQQSAPNRNASKRKVKGLRVRPPNGQTKALPRRSKTLRQLQRTEARRRTVPLIARGRARHSEGPAIT
jgi:hypothetical protein